MLVDLEILKTQGLYILADCLQHGIVVFQDGEYIYNDPDNGHVTVLGSDAKEANKDLIDMCR
jgi:hypothetical protein